MAKIKDKDLQVGDVVEFKPNGGHKKLTGTVFEDRHGRTCIQCADLVVGASKDGVGGRNYKIISRNIPQFMPNFDTTSKADVDADGGIIKHIEKRKIPKVNTTF